VRLLYWPLPLGCNRSEAIAQPYISIDKWNGMETRHTKYPQMTNGTVDENIIMSRSTSELGFAAGVFGWASSRGK